MLRFLSKLARQFQTATITRTPRRAPRRALLQLEGLEDRLVLSAATASLTGSTPDVIAHRPSEQITFTGDKHPGELDVLLGNRKLGHFPIAKVQNVNVSLKSLDAVTVDDSRGFPFADLQHPHSGKKVEAHEKLELPSGMTVKAGEYYAELNKLEKRLNDLGHSLRDRAG
jgi:hypothetical protein